MLLIGGLEPGDLVVDIEGFHYFIWFSINGYSWPLGARLKKNAYLTNLEPRLTFFPAKTRPFFSNQNKGHQSGPVVQINKKTAAEVQREFPSNFSVESKRVPASGVEEAEISCKLWRKAIPGC